MSASPSCPLCEHPHSYPLPVAGKRYHRCQGCELVWLEAADHLDARAEKAVYDDHDNRVDDPGYRRFLMRAFGEVTSRLAPPASGLDFGCGPGPALIAMGCEAGYQMAGYDKFYADAPELLEREYDFITSTEVMEHIADPKAVLDRLWNCLKPGGLLVLQTQRVLGDERFITWRYRHDPTHITFFAEASFRTLATRWRAGVEFPHPDVVVFTKP